MELEVTFDARVPDAPPWCARGIPVQPRPGPAVSRRPSIPRASSRRPTEVRDERRHIPRASLPHRRREPRRSRAQPRLHPLRPLPHDLSDLPAHRIGDLEPARADPPDARSGGGARGAHGRIRGGDGLLPRVPPLRERVPCRRRVRRDDGVHARKARGDEGARPHRAPRQVDRIPARPSEPPRSEAGGERSGARPTPPADPPGAHGRGAARRGDRRPSPCLRAGSAVPCPPPRPREAGVAAASSSWRAA